MKELKVIIGGGVKAPINSTMTTLDASLSPIDKSMQQGFDGNENKSPNQVWMRVDRNLLRLVLIKNTTTTLLNHIFHICENRN